MVAALAVAQKYLLGTYDFWTIFAYMRVGFLFALPILLYLGFNSLKNSIKRYGKRVMAVMTISELLGQAGALVLLLATALASVTLVNTFSSTQPFFVLLFVVVIGAFYPRILREDMNRSTMAIKIIATALVFIGGLLIVG